MMESVIIGLVQMQSKVNDQIQNLYRIEKYIKEAADKKADIICFPEASIDGYSKEITCKDILDSNIVIEKFSKLSQKYGITILVGYIEKTAFKKPFISHLIATPDGKVENYRKTHLGESEFDYFESGDKISVFDTPKAKIGIQICWESHFPEISTVMALKGVDIIFIPFASPSKDRKHIWLKYLRARAYDNSIFIGACNLISENGEGITFTGGAVAIDPKGNVIGEDFEGNESILFVKLDKNIIEEIRNPENKKMSQRQYIKYRRPELYDF